MPLPPNTLPLMTGTGPFGPVEMGGMFTVMKVRDGLEPGDYRDPGWYKHPQGTVAYEIDVAAAGNARPTWGRRISRHDKNAGNGNATAAQR
jgi:manganese oxidase